METKYLNFLQNDKDLYSWLKAVVETPWLVVVFASMIYGMQTGKGIPCSSGTESLGTWSASAIQCQAYQMFSIFHIYWYLYYFLHLLACDAGGGTSLPSWCECVPSKSQGVFLMHTSLPVSYAQKFLLQTCTCNSCKPKCIEVQVYNPLRFSSRIECNDPFMRQTSVVSDKLMLWNSCISKWNQWF